MNFLSHAQIDEYVICREFDRNIKLISEMVSGGIHARVGQQHNLGLLEGWIILNFMMTCLYFTPFNKRMLHLC